MLLKTITFLDLDGNSLTEDFWFHLNKAEVTEMELQQDGGLTAYLTHIVESNNATAIIGTFKDIITRSHGHRNADGKGFDKSPEISRKFLQSDAYSELFMELVTSEEASSAFIRGIVPTAMVSTDGVILKQAGLPVPDSTLTSVPTVQDGMLTMIPTVPDESQLSGVATVMSEPTDSGIAKVMTEPTQKELMAMTHDELVAAMKAKNEQLH